MKEPTEHIVEELEAKDCNVYGNAQTAQAKMKEIQRDSKRFLTDEGCKMLLKNDVHEEIKLQQMLNHIDHTKKS